ADVTPTYEDFLRRVHPADREVTDAMVQRALNDPAASLYHAEFRTCTGGRERWLDSRGRAMFDDAGRCVRFTGMILDITAPKRVESRTVAARDEAEAANRAK